jgi:hypothetical protein
MLGNQHGHPWLSPKELEYVTWPPSLPITESFSDKLQNFGHITKLAGAKQEERESSNAWAKCLQVLTRKL